MHLVLRTGQNSVGLEPGAKRRHLEKIIHHCGRTQLAEQNTLKLLIPIWRLGLAKIAFAI